MCLNKNSMQNFIIVIRTQTFVTVNWSWKKKSRINKTIITYSFIDGAFMQFVSTQLIAHQFRYVLSSRNNKFQYLYKKKIHFFPSTLHFYGHGYLDYVPFSVSLSLEEKKLINIFLLFQFLFNTHYTEYLLSEPSI